MKRQQSEVLEAEGLAQSAIPKSKSEGAELLTERERDEKAKAEMDQLIAEEKRKDVEANNREKIASFFKDKNFERILYQMHQTLSEKVA